jgi:hypothetical protein
MDRLLNTESNRSLDHILDKSVVLELDALTQSDKVFFTSSLLLWVHHRRMTETRRETFKHVTLIEEAHHLLSDERRSLVGGQSVMEIIFREIREFGEALILLDQHPSKISLPALGNCYTTICLNLKHKTDINAMGQCLLLDKERDILGMLDVGQAVVKLQGRIARPFEIHIPHFRINKGIITDDLLKQHMRHIAPALPEPDFRLPAGVDGAGRSGSEPELQSGPLEDVELAFLRDVQKDPDSGVAARYKRLGLSGRQGQKIKVKLLERDLIQENQEITKNGRLTITPLTEKAKKLLAGESANQ